MQTHSVPAGILLALLTVGFLLPLSASADVFVGRDYFLKGGESVSDDVYVFGPSATFAGAVSGDAVALSRDIESDSAIAADALFIGESVSLRGSVADDARLIAETVLVSGTVKDDLVIFAAKVLVLPSAHIGWNLYVVGGDVEVRGAVAGDVRLYAGASRVSATV